MSLKRLVVLLPTPVTLGAIAALLLHGRVLQFPDYNQFADRSTLWGIPNARNVLSNAGFALVGLIGLWRLAPRRREPALRRGFWGYAVCLVAAADRAIPPDRLQSLGERRRVRGPDGAHRPPPITLK